jgi:hypothetical protein
MRSPSVGVGQLHRALLTLESFSLMSFAKRRALCVGCVAGLAQLACTPPGEGPKALAGFKASAAIIQGLGEYRSKNAAYPATLQALVPELLTTSQLAPPSGVSHFDYEPHGASFTLRFKYSGPGSNTCAFESSSRAWTCTGLF